MMATMLDCKTIQPRISEYIDGAMDGDTAWNVKLHLSSCAVCARVADELRATSSLLRSLPTLEPSANFEALLASRLADQALRPARPTLLSRLRDAAEWWRMPRLSPALATSVVAVAAAIPAVFLLTLHSTATHTSAPTLSGQALPRQAAATAAAGDDTLDEIWQEHATYASSEPLADPAGMLQARATAATAPAANGQAISSEVGVF